MFHIAFNGQLKRAGRLLLPIFALLTIFLISCSSSSDPMDEIVNGSISYPFVEQQPFGINRPKEKFVIKSAVGNAQYTIEIPGAGEDYDIEVPLASLSSSALGGPMRPQDISNPVRTDRELTKSFPDPTKEQKNKQALLNRAFGSGPKGGPTQGPSYSLGIAKISQLYKQKNYEYTLIEINNLLNYYPTSPRLHKMKGTVFFKIGNLHLAEKSWLKALDLTPYDAVLKKSIRHLQKKMRQRRSDFTPISSVSEDDKEKVEIETSLASESSDNLEIDSSLDLNDIPESDGSIIDLTSEAENASNGEEKMNQGVESQIEQSL